MQPPCRPIWRRCGGASRRSNAAVDKFEYIHIGPARLMAIDRVIEAADTLIAGLGTVIFPEKALSRLARDLPWLKEATSLRRK